MTSQVVPLSALKVAEVPQDRPPRVYGDFRRLEPKSWTTGRATDDREAFAKAEAKSRIRAITGTTYMGAVKYKDPRGEP